MKNGRQDSQFRFAEIRLRSVPLIEYLKALLISLSDDRSAPVALLTWKKLHESLSSDMEDLGRGRR
jgi:hypothetical protein